MTLARTTRRPPEYMSRGAIISECGQFRYLLTREWDPLKSRRAVFVMLNPSTADAKLDDPTIRKCIGFARRWDCGGIVVVNLYAYRATDPADLKKAGWPVGPENDRFIGVVGECAARDGVLICAWGANAVGRERPRKVLDLLRNAGARPMAVAITKSGAPQHPLYAPYDGEPVPL